MAASTPAQMMEDEELMQGKGLQRMEEEELLQGKALQRLEDEDLMQGKGLDTPLQAKSDLPDGLRSGVERLSGVSMDGVSLQRNSAAPARIGALAYAQGDAIHIGPGQDAHLPHEAWHVAQQRQGRVQPTTSVSGVAVNDSPALESEADAMGARAAQMQADPLQPEDGSS